MSHNADLVLPGGSVYTVDAARSWAQAVAIRDRRIVAVGTDTQVGELAGASTQMIDLADRMLLPGFIDAHVHASAAGLERLRCDLSDAHGLDDTRDLPERGLRVEHGPMLPLPERFAAASPWPSVSSLPSAGRRDDG